MKVKSFFGQKSVWIGGFQQSGPLVEKLWSEALASFWPESRISKILILGLGCGSVLKPLLKKFPNCQITGVEIDKEMIDIGKKYFNLEKYTNLKIVCDDAKNFCEKTKEKYDLILVDMYKGNVPEKSKVYLKNLNKNGIVLTNHLEGLKNRFSVLPLEFLQLHPEYNLALQLSFQILWGLLP